MLNFQFSENLTEVLPQETRTVFKWKTANTSLLLQPYLRAQMFTVLISYAHLHVVPYTLTDSLHAVYLVYINQMSLHQHKNNDIKKIYLYISTLDFRQTLKTISTSLPHPKLPTSLLAIANLNTT